MSPEELAAVRAALAEWQEGQNPESARARLLRAVPALLAHIDTLTPPPDPLAEWYAAEREQREARDAHEAARYDVKAQRLPLAEALAVLDAARERCWAASARVDALVRAGLTPRG